MKPSLLSTSSTRSRSFEPGIETLPLLRSCALRMRAIISPIGSFTAICPSSPARLHEAGDQALVAELAQRDAAQAVLAVIAARTAGHLAAIADAGRRGIAWQFGELQRRREAVLDRQFLVLHDRLELLPAVGE